MSPRMGGDPVVRPVVPDAAADPDEPARGRESGARGPGSGCSCLLFVSISGAAPPVGLRRPCL